MTIAPSPSASHRTEPPPSAPSRRERFAWGSGVAVVVALGYAVVLLFNARFFYQDDTEGGAVPIWVDVGSALRRGDLPLLVPGQWMAGNYAVEGQASLLNPVQLVVNLIAPSVDHMAGYATLVKLVFAVILATGVYRVALEYGASPHWAAAVGAAMPFTGFTLYYDSATWVTGMMGSAWVAQAWASTVRYARGRAGPVPPFAFLYLALSVGYAHAAIMAAVVVACALVAEVVEGRWRGALRAGMAALAAAMCVAITFLPGLLSVYVTSRGTLQDPLLNDGFLSAPWSETLAMSLPSHLPAIDGFAGPIQRTPVTYVAWFVLPALAFIQWQRVAASLRSLSGPLLLLATAFVLTAGPSLMGPLRWPARLLPYVAMAVLVTVALLLSRFLVAQVTRARLLVVVALVAVSVLRAASADPDYLRRHALTGLLVLGLTVVAVLLGRRLGARAVAVWLMVSVLPVVALMMRWQPLNPDVRQWNFPATRSEALAVFPGYPGTTLQLGSYSLVPRDERTLDRAWGALVFGNYARFLQRDYVNAYTPVGFTAFSSLLCMDYAGSTCPEALDRVFESEPTTGLPYADLMGLDRVVLQRSMFPAPPRPLPAGWVAAAEDDQVIVLERSQPRRSDGSRVVASEGAQEAEVLESTGERERLVVDAPNGGTLVFSRLPWPGYTATVDGRTVEVAAVDDLFVSVDVPPTDGPAELTLTYQPPGFRLGAGLALAGLALLVLLQIEHARRPSRRRPEHASTDGDRAVDPAVLGRSEEAAGTVSSR
jgi:hypothetical protein